MNPWSTRKHSRSSISPVVLVTLAGVVVSSIFFVRLRSAENELKAIQSWNHTVLDSLGRALESPPPPLGPQGRDSIYWQWTALSARMDARRFQGQLQEARQRRGNLLNAGDIAALRDAGLLEPAKQLRDSLLARHDLIPFKEVAGGQMRFFPDRIVLLERPYVFAYAEDGHQGGYILLAYDVKPGPRVRWRKVWWAELE